MSAYGNNTKNNKKDEVKVLENLFFSVLLLGRGVLRQRQQQQSLQLADVCLFVCVGRCVGVGVGDGDTVAGSTRYYWSTRQVAKKMSRQFA